MKRLNTSYRPRYTVLDQVHGVTMGRTFPTRSAAVREASDLNQLEGADTFRAVRA